MSKSGQAELTDNGLTESVVEEYLHHHRDFFEGKDELLLGLKLKHPLPGEGMVSLIERQVDLLRKNNHQLERRLRDLISVARDNENLVERTHQLGLTLYGVNDRLQILDIVERALREQFGADGLSICLFNELSGSTGVVRTLPRDSQQLEPFAAFLAKPSPTCGMLGRSQLEFLFAQQADDIHSAALVGLGANAEMGMMAIGSHSGERFSPAMGTLFLSRIADIVAAALARV